MSVCSFSNSPWSLLNTLGLVCCCPSSPGITALDLSVLLLPVRTGKRTNATRPSGLSPGRCLVLGFVSADALSWLSCVKKSEAESSLTFTHLSPLSTRPHEVQAHAPNNYNPCRRCTQKCARNRRVVSIPRWSAVVSLGCSSSVKDIVC